MSGLAADGPDHRTPHQSQGVSGMDIWNVIVSRQDRLEDRIDHAEEKLEGVPELRRSVDRLTVAVYSTGVMILGSAVVVLLVGPPS